MSRINKDTLNEIRAIAQQSNPELLRIMIDSYLEETPLNIQAIAAAMDKHDMDTLRERAHSLKSTSLTIGADSVAELALTIEQQAKAGQFPTASAIQSLESELASSAPLLLGFIKDSD